MREHRHRAPIINSNRLHIVSVFLLAFSVRFFSVYALLGLDWNYPSDGYENAVLIPYILDGACYMPPGQYLLTGAINQLFGLHNYAFMRTAIIILSSCISIPIYLIGKEHFGRRAGIAAGYLSALSPTYMVQSWTFYPATLAAFLFAFFLLYFLRTAKTRRLHDLIASAALLGLCCITRPETIALVPVAGIWLLLAGRGAAYPRIGRTALFVCIAVLPALIWSIRNYCVCEKAVFISSNGPVNFYIGNNPVQKGSYLPPVSIHPTAQDYLKSAVAYNRLHPGWMLTFYAKKFMLFWSPHTNEHPLRLLESRFKKSTIALFNPRFSESRLARLLKDKPHYSERAAALYRIAVPLFWACVTAGLLVSHRFASAAYFIIAACLVRAAVQSVFFTGGCRFFLPVLSCAYLIMGLGIAFITHPAAFVRGGAIKTIAVRNALLLCIIGGLLLGGKILLTCPPSTRAETVTGIERWNIARAEQRFVSVSILESQLAYPLMKRDIGISCHAVQFKGSPLPFSRRIIPPHYGRGTAAQSGFNIIRMKNLLSPYAIAVRLDASDLPGPVIRQLKQKNPSHAVIAKHLEGLFRVSYTPSWQLCPRAEKCIQNVLLLLYNNI